MKKKSGVYKIIITTIKINKVIIKNINLSLNLNKFTEDFAEMSILLLINYFLKYNNFLSYAESRDMMAIAILLGLLRQTILLQKVMNSVAQC